LGVTFGAVVAAVATVMFVAMKGDRLPVLTQTKFDAAEKRWREQGPKSYRMDIHIGGRQPGELHVEVRNGEVTGAARNGVPLKEARTWDPWSVDALLDIVGEELAAAADSAQAAKKFGVPEGATILQAAVFDEKYGYPRRYRRSVLGTPMDLDWEITRFEPVDQVISRGDAEPQR
jgi:hypothetical protein